MYSLKGIQILQNIYFCFPQVIFLFDTLNANACMFGLQELTLLLPNKSAGLVLRQSHHPIARLKFEHRQTMPLQKRVQN